MPLTIDISNFNESVSRTAAASGTQTLDIGTHNNFYIELSGDISISVTNPSSNPQGNSFTVLLEQDGTGGHAVTSFQSGVEWTDGTKPTIDPTAGTATLVSFISMDGGSRWIGMVGAVGAE
jgi:hypothetical protein